MRLRSIKGEKTRDLNKEYLMSEVKGAALSAKELLATVREMEKKNEIIGFLCDIIFLCESFNDNLCVILFNIYR